MSEFDKEAEREKLRQKYERDREKRKETERMSQLLLQGATMTNRHCDTCGDPLFRYQDNEFCATCEGRAQEADAAARGAQAGAADDAEETGATEGETTTVSSDADDAGQTEAAETSQPLGDGHDTAGRSPGESETPATSRATDGTTTPTGPVSAGQPAEAERAATAATAAPRASENDADLGTVRASLIRTMTHHARQAEGVEDPRRATDHLTAVREAAAALAALDGRR